MIICTQQKVVKEMIKRVKFTVKQARQLREISQTVMAKTLKMSLPTYVSKEQNPGNFKMSEAELFLQAVGLSRGDVIFVPSDTTKCCDGKV